MSNGPEEEKGAGAFMNSLIGGLLVSPTFRILTVTLGRDDDEPSVRFTTSST